MIKESHLKFYALKRLIYESNLSKNESSQKNITAKYL